jgi:type I restriction enzyme R subunit
LFPEDRNDFLAINQYRVDPPWATGNRGFIVPDIVLLVNGIPLVVIECKSPKLDNPIIEAIHNLLQYFNQRGSSQPEGAEKLCHYNQLMIAAVYPSHWVAPATFRYYKGELVLDAF